MERLGRGDSHKACGAEGSDKRDLQQFHKHSPNGMILKRVRSDFPSGILRDSTKIRLAANRRGLQFVELRSSLNA